MVILKKKKKKPRMSDLIINEMSNDQAVEYRRSFW